MSPMVERAPVKAGDANGAFKSRAVAVAVDTPFFKSLAFSTLAKLTMALGILKVVLVNVGLLSGAFRSRAVAVAVDIVFLNR